MMPELPKMERLRFLGTTSVEPVLADAVCRNVFGLPVVPNDQLGALRLIPPEHRARMVITSPVVLALWGQIERRHDSVIGQPRIVV
jgi:hypothetical protein